MNCNVEITAVGTADGLEVSIHGGSVGMMTAAELIVARVLMAVADDEENLAGLKDSMFEMKASTDETVAVYLAGCFNPDKLTVKDSYTMTEADKDALRMRDIVLLPVVEM